ncbi:MAG: TonB-dependent receptor [Chitinophagaceae bacterium]|nr:TonB-dependent receptor [Chitinophagaceae bacterium]
MQKICLHIIFLLGFVYGIKAQQSSPVADSSQKRIRTGFSGRVIQAASDMPLQGASIYISDIKAGVATNSDGRFTMKNIPPGRHLVEISFVGYSTVSEYVDMRGDIQREFALYPEVAERNAVVITGVSSATQAKRIPTPITIIRRQDLLKNVSVNIVDAISKSPGIAQLSTGPAISKPVIRGLGYNRVVILNDGVRQEGQQWGDEHGIEIDEYSVSKIEILKGPASLSYGSDAMAGVINIITNVPVPDGTVRGNIISNYQTNNRLRGIGGNIAGNQNGFNWNAYGSLKAAADYENRYDGRVYNSKFNEKNFGGYVGYNGNWGYTHILFSRFHQSVGIVEGDRNDNGQFVKPLPGGLEGLPSKADFNSTIPQIPRQDIKHFKIAGDNSFNIGNARLTFNAAYQRNQRIEFGNADDPSEKELYFDLKTITLSGIYHLAEKNSWRTSIGLNGLSQNNKNKGEEVLIPQYSLFDIGAFMYLQKTWGNLSMSGGVRYDHRSLSSKSFFEGSDLKFVAFNKNFSNVSGSIGFTIQPSSMVTIKLNAARGFRAPNIPELASNGAHEGSNRYEYGDKNLKSETSLQLDGGFELSSEHISMEAGFFHNDINNFIFYRKLISYAGGDSAIDVNGSMTPAFQFDQRKAKLAGLELKFDIHPHPLDWLHIENSFSYVRGVFKKSVEGTKNIPFIPAARLISEIRADFFQQGKFIRNLSLKAELDNTFRQSNAFTGYNTETETGAYTLFNAGIGTDIMTKKNKVVASIYLNALNIGDVAYQNHLSRLKYAAGNIVTGRNGVYNMGRNFSVKVNIPLSFTPN